MTTSANRQLAVYATGLYLVNLLLLPGIGFVIIAVMYFHFYSRSTTFESQYLCAAFRSSLAAGVLLLVIPALMLRFNGFSDLAWLWGITYFVVMHGVCVIWGVVLLSKAMSGRELNIAWLVCPR